MSDINKKNAVMNACLECNPIMEWIELPDYSGTIYVRFFRCPNCGIIKVDTRDEDSIGWG